MPTTSLRVSLPVVPIGSSFALQETVQITHADLTAIKFLSSSLQHSPECLKVRSVHPQPDDPP